MQNKNIVLFSSGISEEKGLLSTLMSALNERGYVCECWRDLFANANDANNIALLPMLIKKIPTFDYAVLVCEGHDITTIKRRDSNETVYSMRDNVLFEIGLCVMALGLSRTILITDSKTRLPDDLVGLNHETALKRITYSGNDEDSYARVSDSLTDYLISMESVSDEIDQYIQTTGYNLSPVIIGAASSTACGYVSNFVFRTLEHINDGIVFKADGQTHRFPIEKVFMHIILPKTFDKTTSRISRGVMSQYQQGCIPSARNRSAEFCFEIRGDELHIIDFPTTLVTSYDIAKIILSLNADDTMDKRAAARFTSKELNLYEANLRHLLSENYLTQVINEQYPDLDADKRHEMIKRVLDIIENRLYIEYFDDTENKINA